MIIHVVCYRDHEGCHSVEAAFVDSVKADELADKLNEKLDMSWSGYSVESVTVRDMLQQSFGAKK